MEVLRTSDERFVDLPGYPFAPNYTENLRGFDGLRMHWIDEGPRDARQTFLCLHGEPTWSYLYRRMIPVFSAAGIRSVAPDFFGFGKSDKPADDATYTFDFHRRSMMAFIEQLDLRNVTLVCQDWGGLIGLTLPMDMPDRFEGLLAMNTALGTGDTPLTKGFLDWRAWAAANPDMKPGRLMQFACPHLSEAEWRAYSAPFPDIRFKGGVRRFPQLVPDRPDAPGAELSRRAREWWKNEWRGRSFMAIGATDPVLGLPVMTALRQTIRNCPEPMVLQEAGHFTQEWGEPIASRAVEVLSGR
jgi:haloalkane dehalogenase